MANNHSNRVILDAIHQSIRADFIPEDQLSMLAKHTNGVLGSMSCRICTSKGEEILLCSFDKEGDNYMLFPYFQEEEGLVSMCDYILFVEDEKTLFVFLVELKDSSHRSKKQVLLSQPFAEFLVNRVKAANSNVLFCKDIEYRKIGVKSKCYKMTTRGHASLAYDKDGFAILPDYHNFYIKWLKEL